MAGPVYVIQPNPKWYLVNNLGMPLAPNGFIFTYRSLNKNELKYAFQDPAGLIPWTDPIPIDANGTVGPIYWEFDPANPSELYYIRVCASNDPDNLVWDFDGLPVSGSGGGGTITTVVNTTNLITNNVCWRNIGTSITPLPEFLVVAPGAHAGFAKTVSNYGPDICFIKNNTNAVDQITFPRFSPGLTPFSPDATPVDFTRYTCTNSPSGETLKVFQYPITTQVNNLSGLSIVGSIWAQLFSGTGATNITVNLVQFFGDGPSASAPIITPITTLTLTGSWQKFLFGTAVPNISGNTLGECGNSGLFLQIAMPLDASCDIAFTKPGVWLTADVPTTDYTTYDMIDGVINAQRTGYVMTGFDASAPGGYVIMNDGTIGSASSGATTRQNIDTFPLFNLLWNQVTSQANGTNVGGTGYAQLYDSTGAPLATVGSSAIADFVANKRLGLTKQLGRVISSAGLAYSTGVTTWALGQYGGEEKHTQVEGELAMHNHSGSSVTTPVRSSGTVSGPPFNAAIATSQAGTSTLTDTLTIAEDGSSTPMNITQATSFMNFFIKL